MPEILNLAVYLLTGAVAGLFAGLLGVGGGLIIVPALIWVFHGIGFDDSIVVHLAIGTSLATIIITSISSIRAHHKRGAVLWDSVVKLAPGIVVGAWLGAAIADMLPTLGLQRVFACFVILIGLQMLSGARADAHRTYGLSSFRATTRPSTTASPPILPKASAAATRTLGFWSPRLRARASMTR